MAKKVIITSSVNAGGSKIAFIFYSNGKIMFSPDAFNIDYTDITETIGTNNFTFELDSTGKTTIREFSETLLQFLGNVHLGDIPVPDPAPSLDDLTELIPEAISFANRLLNLRTDTTGEDFSEHEVIRGDNYLPF